jgi:hypothetical protein
MNRSRSLCRFVAGAVVADRSLGLPARLANVRDPAPGNIETAAGSVSYPSCGFAGGDSVKLPLFDVPIGSGSPREQTISGGFVPQVE